jgi:hypothetical protein
MAVPLFQIECAEVAQLHRSAAVQCLCYAAKNLSHNSMGVLPRDSHLGKIIAHLPYYFPFCQFLRSHKIPLLSVFQTISFCNGFARGRKLFAPKLFQKLAPGDEEPSGDTRAPI